MIGTLISKGYRVKARALHALRLHCYRMRWTGPSPRVSNHCTWCGHPSAVSHDPRAIDATMSDGGFARAFQRLIREGMVSLGQSTSHRPEDSEETTPWSPVPEEKP